MSDIDDDRKLSDAFVSLEPSAAVVARVQVRVTAAHDARPRSLWLEWWSLLRARPVANGALMAVAAVVLLFITPLGALPALLQRGLGAQPLAMRDSAALHAAEPMRAAAEHHAKEARARRAAEGFVTSRRSLTAPRR